MLTQHHGELVNNSAKNTSEKNAKKKERKNGEKFNKTFGGNFQESSTDTHTALKNSKVRCISHARFRRSEFAEAQYVFVPIVLMRVPCCGCK